MSRLEASAQNHGSGHAIYAPPNAHTPSTFEDSDRQPGWVTGFSLRILPDLIPFETPFMPSWKRPMATQTRRRVMGWCAELIPDVTVEIEEWVGADLRHPLHTVIVAFPEIDRPPLALRVKVDEMRRSDLAQALQA